MNCSKINFWASHHVVLRYHGSIAKIEQDQFCHYFQLFARYLDNTQSAVAGLTCDIERESEIKFIQKMDDSKLFAFFYHKLRI